MLAEITAFSDRYEEFDKVNTEVLGVSIDSVVCYNALLFHDIIAYVSMNQYSVDFNFDMY